MGGMSKWLKPKNYLDATLTTMDPGGLVYQSKNKELQKVQSTADVGNIGANPKQAAKAQEEKAAVEKTRVYERDLVKGTSHSYIPGLKI